MQCMRGHASAFVRHNAWCKIAPLFKRHHDASTPCYQTKAQSMIATHRLEPAALSFSNRLVEAGIHQPEGAIGGCEGRCSS